ALVGVAELDRPLRRRSVEARDVLAGHGRELGSQLVGRELPRRSDRPQERDRRRPGSDADLDDARAGVNIAPDQDGADVLRIDDLRLAGQVRDQLRVRRPKDLQVLAGGAPYDRAFGEADQLLGGEGRTPDADALPGSQGPEVLARLAVDEEDGVAILEARAVRDRG